MGVNKIQWFLCLCVGVFGLSGCSESANTTTNAGALSDNTSTPVAVTSRSNAVPDALTMQRWTNSCALCHVDGSAGAPRFGDSAAWAPRIAKGREALMERMVEGYGRMPPLGYCMACEEEDFVALTEFMAGIPRGDLK